MNWQWVAQEIKQECKRMVKREEHKQFILVHPSSMVTSSLPCPTSKENFTKTFNCTITINHTVLTPCKNQEHHWIKDHNERIQFLKQASSTKG